MNQQLTLGMTLGSDQTFGTLVAGPNAEALAAARTARDACSRLLFFWGDSASGRSHLLQALVRDAAEHSRRAALLPLRDRGDWQPEILEGWESLDMIALDDIDVIAGDVEWERAVFNLFNAVRDAGSNLVISASAAPAALEKLLPDLRSRLGSMLVYQWKPLDDAGRLKALQAKAAARGMDLPDDAAHWLLTRLSRDMHHLSAVIDRLDHASLAAQRRLTVPFIREVIGQ